MKYYLQFTLFILLFLSNNLVSNAQSDQVSILNEVILSLKGEIDATDIKVFNNIDEVCDSRFITCNKKKKIIGLDMQFANLNGIIPQNINQLSDLEYINLEYNYIAGTIPEGLSQLKNLEQLSINGNFIEAPLPEDMNQFSKSTFIDLSQNIFKIEDKKLVKKFNIINQFNLEECRSPDSIFLDVELESNKKTLDGVSPNKEDNFKVVEEMPRFPGCENEDISNKEKEDCAKQKMLQFIYRNLRYPYEARVNGIEGMALIQFIILKNGDIGGAKVIRDPGGRCGNASLWIVNRMNYICEKWSPGNQDGTNVKVQYTLPIKFKLEG